MKPSASSGTDKATVFVSTHCENCHQHLHRSWRHPSNLLATLSQRLSFQHESLSASHPMAALIGNGANLDSKLSSPRRRIPASGRIFAFLLFFGFALHAWSQQI